MDLYKKSLHRNELSNFEKEEKMSVRAISRESNLKNWFQRPWKIDQKTSSLNFALDVVPFESSK